MIVKPSAPDTQRPATSAPAVDSGTPAPRPDASARPPAALLTLSKWRRFDVRIALLFAISSLLIIFVAGLFTYQLIVEAKMEGFRKRLETLALTLSMTLDADPIPGLSDRPDQGAEWTASLTTKLQAIVDREPDIDSIYVLLPTDSPARLRFLLDASRVSRVAEPGEVYDATDYPFMLRAFEQVAIEDRVYEDAFGATQSAYAPLRTGAGEVVGIVGVDVLAVRIHETRQRVLVFCVALFGVTAGAFALVALMIRKRVRRPIERVLAATEAISAGRYDQAAAVDGDDEFALVGQHIDAMARQLGERERLRSTFGLYVSHDLARTLLDAEHPPQLGGTERLATVMFCALGNYGRLNECFSPSEIIALANEYLGVLAGVVEENGGCVLDFNGDGLKAVFGAPVAHVDHVERALRTAIRMQQRMNQLNGDWEARGLAARWEQIGLEQLVLRIGIHTGPVIAGNLGCATRMKYAVIGDTVIVASQLEEINKELGTRIALSDEVRQRAEANSLLGFIDYDLRAIRGRQMLVRVYGC